MDSLAARLVNLLVGNGEGDAVLEAALVGPTITFERDTTFALGGADCGARLNGVMVGRWRSFRARAGETLEMGATIVGCHAYMAFDGGIEVEPVLGSRSTFLPASFGGFEGRALKSGDVLALGFNGGSAGRSLVRSLGAQLVPSYGGTLRVIAGAHIARLATAERETFWNTPYVLSRQSDRMGYRLEGAPIAMEITTDVLSAAVTMGTIQLPPGGAPILLMADRQTTGGYPVMGHVATVDLGAAAQLKPGDTVRFEEISLGAAERLYLDRERAMDALRLALSHSP